MTKIEKLIKEKFKKCAKSYNKNYLEETLHIDTNKYLPLLKGELKNRTKEYLFVGIDDYSRELYAGIHPDKS